MSESKQEIVVQPIEILSFTAGRDSNGRAVVLITLRPFPAHSPFSKVVAITREQAQRTHDDLAVILSDDNVTWKEE